MKDTGRIFNAKGICIRQYTSAGVEHFTKPKRASRRILTKFLCVGYYADNLQKVAHIIQADTVEDAELKFFEKCFDECGYPNGSLVAVFPTSPRLSSKMRTRDISNGEQVNFGPSEIDEKCRTCGTRYADGGDGFDGECPSCADKTETRRKRKGKS